MPVMYVIPSDRTIKRVTITKACAAGESEPLLEHEMEKEAPSDAPEQPVDNAS
jgi:ATP-dependent protease Clp ATPase subunit